MKIQGIVWDTMMRKKHQQKHQGKTRSVQYIKQDSQFVTICDSFSLIHLPLYELPMQISPTEFVPFQ